MTLCFLRLFPTLGVSIRTPTRKGGARWRANSRSTAERGRIRFRLKASNGQIILASEGYKAKACAVRGIESVKRNAATVARFVRKPSKEQFMFNLTATNGQVIGTSERYMSERGL